MTSGPAGFSRQAQPQPGLDPDVPALPQPGTDPLLRSPDQPHQPEPSAAANRPRGHRHRRTTLPRATRGWSRGIVWTLIGLTGFGTIYGLVARIDSSIEASGKLLPLRGVTAVSAPFNSLVTRVLIREGELVRPGQPLLQLRAEALLKQRDQLLAIQASWRKEVAVLAAQLGLSADLASDPLVRRQLQIAQLEVRLRTQAAQQDSARSVINTAQQLSDLAALRRKLAINRLLTQRIEKLHAAGGISLLDLDRQKEREIEVEMALRRTELEVESGRRRERESNYRTLQIGVADQKQLFSAYDNAQQQLRETATRLVELNERIALSNLRAPVAGRVFDLAVKQGELVSPGRPALRLVPESGVEASVSITNRDIGFVQVGMPVEVRVVSFPFTDYGAIKGTVIRISADSQPADPTHPQDYFETTVRLASNRLERHGTRYELRPGMAITALLQLGPRPVLSLLGDRFSLFLDSTRKIR